MKEITDAAGQKLKATLDETNAEEKKAIRLIMSDQGAELKLDLVRESDQVFEHEDRKVLVLDATASKATSESTLDYKGGRFYFV
jgi:Fe-S cluster assembly iron-binding protein IscA